MKKVLLQNHPGSEKYSFNGWEIFNSNFERMIKENKAMLLCKWGFYLTCVVAVMFVFAAITSNGLNERGLTRIQIISATVMDWRRGEASC